LLATALSRTVGSFMDTAAKLKFMTSRNFWVHTLAARI
jgi:hypothetical protein